MSRTWPVAGLAVPALAVLAATAPPPAPVRGTSAPALAVTVQNFARAESDMYFAKAVSEGAFGKLKHNRVPVAIDKQDVIRMNRDTLYSKGVFDLDAGPVTIKLPDTGKRFMSLQVIDEDHYSPPVVYAPGRYTYTRRQVGTRYMLAAVRTAANATDPADLQAANAAQDGIQVQQAAAGRFEIPNWDAAAREQVGQAVLFLAMNNGVSMAERFGTRAQVDPIQHLLFTAAGWAAGAVATTAFWLAAAALEAPPKPR